jgi:hypothetical protein
VDAIAHHCASPLVTETLRHHASLHPRATAHHCERDRPSLLHCALCTVHHRTSLHCHCTVTALSLSLHCHYHCTVRHRTSLNHCNTAHHCTLVTLRITVDVTVLHCCTASPPQLWPSSIAPPRRCITSSPRHRVTAQKTQPTTPAKTDSRLNRNQQRKLFTHRYRDIAKSGQSRHRKRPPDKTRRTNFIPTSIFISSDSD